MNKGSALSGGVIVIVIVLAIVVIAAIGYYKLGGQHGVAPEMSDSRMQRMYGRPNQGGASNPAPNPASSTK